MLYRDDVPNVEVGVLVRGRVHARGPGDPLALPAGEVVAVTHRGPYDRLGEAHEAVLRHIAEHGLETTRHALGDLRALAGRCPRPRVVWQLRG